MLMTAKANVAVLLLASAAPVLALPADFAAKADEYVEQAWPAAGPGAAVIVTEGGKTVYARGQGLADLEAKKAITPATVFRLGSITKQMSAAVLMQLVDEGKVSLDDLVSKYVPSLPQPGASATVRQILNHTSGVQSYTGIPGWMVEENTNRPYTTEQMIALFKDLPSPNKPGETWTYNNSGYVLVGAVIEAATGQPWHRVLEERLSNRLGLKTIRYGVGEAGMPDMAKGYTDGEQGPKLATKIHMSVPHAAGALVGSVEDLARWNHALHHGKVMSSQSYSAMTAPSKVLKGEDVPYGFGIGQEKVRGRHALGHGGGIFGFSTDSVYIPEKDLFVAVFTNSDEPQTSPGTATQRLAALALGEPYPEFRETSVEAAALEPLFGVYKLKEGERRFYAREGQLYTRRGDSPESRVYPAGNDRFFYGPSSLNWFEVKRAASGAHVMEMHQGGADEAERWVRSGPVPAVAKAEVPRATLERYVGKYQINKASVVVAWGAGDKLTIQPPGEKARLMNATSATEFEVEGVPARVTFSEVDGKISGLVLKLPNRDMIAERIADGK